MKQSVKDAFVAFTSKFEGVVRWMYLDIKGLVTVGIGNLCDPVGIALGLPFVHDGDYPASRDEIALAWHTVKDRQDLARLGHRACEHLTTIRLTPEGINQVVNDKLQENWGFLAKRFPDIEDWPADAQLGILSMAWAAGPGFIAPKFSACCRLLDFEGAARECRFQDSHNPGLVPRNDANEVLFRNAQNVLGSQLDPEILYYSVG